jgi:hypothetical protein
MTIKQLLKALYEFMKDMGGFITPIIALVSFAYLYTPWQELLNVFFFDIIVWTLFLSFIFSLFKRIYLKYRNSFTIRFYNPDFQIEVKYGNLFEEKSNIIVGFNNYFDTQMPEVISPSSIQGQFEQLYYKDNIEKLDNDIKNALMRKKIFANMNDTKTKGKRKNFPLGSTITVENDKQKFFLCAYSNMNDNAKAESNICILNNSLNELWTEIRNSNQCNPIATAVLGSGLARISASKMELLITIITNFIASSREQVITKKLTIVLNKLDKQKYNLSKIETILKNISEN